MIKVYLGMTGLDGEGQPWTASRVRPHLVNLGQTISANNNVAYNALPLAA